MSIVISKNWEEILKDEFNQSYFQSLTHFIQKEIENGKTIYPPIEDIYKAFLYTSYDEVRVVILGQDPYHGPNQAHGLCFSVKKGVKIPPSLKNIYKELQNDLNLQIPEHGCLTQWANQGVLLLNSTLTVNKGAPKSHFGQGWEKFTDAVVNKLIERREPVVFLLWGNSAHQKGELIKKNSSHHAVLKCAHPSPFSARKFFGCRHFSKTNQVLISWKVEPIDWQIT
ncbi:MAG: uracil-DNA glycosylase [Rhabdochlamydiaceae bacterium]|nr:uracil-DNA glycosylase [Candidatus Amphrikana amoebophyrae]